MTHWESVTVQLVKQYHCRCQAVLVTVADPCEKTMSSFISLLKTHVKGHIA